MVAEFNEESLASVGRSRGGWVLASGDDSWRWKKHLHQPSIPHLPGARPELGLQFPILGCKGVDAFSKKLFVQDAACMMVGTKSRAAFFLVRGGLHARCNDTFMHGIMGLQHTG